jgi:hypothetical protein
VTTWRDASFLLLQTKGKEKKTDERVSCPCRPRNDITQCRKYQLHAAKCKCMNLDPRNMHIGRTAAWTKWEQLRRAVHGSTLSWAGREAREGGLPAVLQSSPMRVQGVINSSDGDRGTGTGTRKDQQLAHFSFHPSCLRLWRLWEISHQELFCVCVCVCVSK